MSVRERIRAVALAVVAGCIFVWFNFNGLMRHFVKGSLSPESWFAKSVVAVSLWPKHIFGSSTEVLYFWMVVCFIGIWVYLGAILLLALVRGRPALAGWGVLGVIGGGFTPALLCWAGLLVWGIFKVVRVIVGFIGHVLYVVMAFIIKALIFVSPVLLVIALVAGIVWAWKAHGPKLVLSAVAGALGLYFLVPLLKPILEKIRLFLIWIAETLAYLFRWLPAVLLWLVKAVAVLLGITSIIGIVGCAGQILIDQLKTAVEAGRSQKGLFTASLSIGVSMALIFLVAAGTPEAAPLQAWSTVSAPAQQRMMIGADEKTTLAKPKKRRKKRRVRKVPVSAPAVVVLAPAPVPVPAISTTIDRAWTRSTWIFKTASPTRVFLATLPATIRDWARESFRTATAPTFDAVVVALVLGLSLIGLLRGIFSRSELEYKMRFYNKDLLMIAAVPIIVVLLLLFGQLQENQE